MPTTYELKKHVGAIHVADPSSLLLRKAFNVLLHNAYHELVDPEVRSHTITVADLAALAGYTSKDVGYLVDSVERLVTTAVRWNLLDPDGAEEVGVAAMVSEFKVKRGVCTYTYPPALRAMLHNPEIYARINLDVQKRFTSAYGLKLYENCLRFRRVGTTGWIALEDWRSLLGVEDGAYPRYSELRRRVFAPAVRQVNEFSEIRVAMETQRERSRTARVRFSVSEATPEPAALGPTGQKPDADDGPPDLTVRLRQFGLTDDQVARALGRGDDVVRRNLDHVERFIRDGGEVRKSPAAMLVAAVKGDYAGAEAAARPPEPARAEPAVPSPAAASSAHAERAAADRERELDRRWALLDPEDRVAVDGQAFEALLRHPEFLTIAKAVNGGDESALGPYAGGALRSARRDALEGLGL